MQFAVYPNPAHDNITLSIDAKEQAAYNIQLTDLSGRRLISEEHTGTGGLNTYKMDLSGLAKGVYMISVQSETESWKAKVAVE